MKKDVYTLPVGELRANCYIVDCGGGTAAVIDPGAEFDVILSRLRALSLRPGAVLLTHGHFDHVGASAVIAEEYGCPVRISDAERKLPLSLRRGLCDPTCNICDGERSIIGELCFSVISTPGHSLGSVCYSCEDLLFTGDTLFRSAFGRTDLYGGSVDDMMASLARLAALPFDARVLPSHGDETTLGRERRENFAVLAAVRDLREE